MGVKRSLGEVDQAETKKSKRGIDLLDLPTEILYFCFSFVEPTDVINLSGTCSRYRTEISPYIFKRINLTWMELIDIEKTELEKFAHKYQQMINQVRIADSYSNGEWQHDIFEKIEKYMPNTKSLLINSGESSYWLKYRSSPLIKCLSLYYESDHLESTDIFLKNPRKIKHSKKKSSLRMFDLEHLKGFGNLTSLYLDQYHLSSMSDTNDELVQVNLQDLKLVNCTWEYPFDLSQFNRHNKLKKLIICYTDNNAFILSERFRRFLDHPLENGGSSLESLSITFAHYDSSWNSPLYLRQLEKFSPKSLPSLHILELNGWSIELKDIYQYTNLLMKFNLHYLLFSSAQFSKSSTEALEEAVKRVRDKIPWMKLKLSS
ncbi:Piso0_003713 [Millerozyma farinosa CBS 7064]|uniref:Piso0_003713 protein n=1 Tax=Pichia sorbitophila (strain ATCC MYA-4447 / BCRC 22081 / CBS 7064 / NBRC 10061 / NRRL Y-12695) TaxID=559304 RepID=G8Y6E2_PICSO|nr:Piso0_003713 [Millerozyma farinosa CBS 7064]CCE84172.1 Piso0_003713 [Millerozyma farinosa CBS 7064]